LSAAIAAKTTKNPGTIAILSAPEWSKIPVIIAAGAAAYSIALAIPSLTIWKLHPVKLGIFSLPPFFLESGLFPEPSVPLLTRSRVSYLDLPKLPGHFTLFFFNLVSNLLGRDRIEKLIVKLVYLIENFVYKLDR
jgi:hypothetical protein